MGLLELLLYGLASFIALRSLVTLMANHQERYKQKIAEELAAAQRQANGKAEMASREAAVKS